MPTNVRQTLYGADLNITGFKTLSKDKLKEHILESVKDTQIFAGRHLPDKLFMTEDQFKMLEEDLDRTEDMTMRIYWTPLNVMEVHVVDMESLDKRLKRFEESLEARGIE